jgi:hypothetical protein
MKLINLNTGEVFLHAEPGSTPEFTQSHMNDAMSKFGLIIPVGLQEKYNGKTRVYLDEPEFLEAFRELYFEHEMKPNGFAWQ